MKEIKLHVLDEAGKRVWRGRCATEPAAIASAICRYAPAAVRIGLETGPLTTWLWTELTAEGLPMVCLDARHAKKALDMKVNKTDANDAEGLAHLVRAGWYRKSGSKAVAPCLQRHYLAHVVICLASRWPLRVQIRGTAERRLAGSYQRALVGYSKRMFMLSSTHDAKIAAVIMPLLQARQITRSKCAALDRRLVAAVRGNATCRMLMTMPGIGPITAVAYVAALERPDTFKRSRAVGAGLGSRRGAFNQARSIMTVTSRDRAIVSCVRSFTRPPPFS